MSRVVACGRAAWRVFVTRYHRLLICDSCRESSHPRTRPYPLLLQPLPGTKTDLTQRNFLAKTGFKQV